MLQIMVLPLVVIVAIIVWFAARSYERKQYDSKVGSAEQKSREIIDEALKTAETKKREALLEAKEESLKTKNELEKETKERRAELQRYEKRVLSKEENVENETSLQTALSALLKDKTVLVIAHRMRTVMGADHVVVLADGHVAEEGTPEQLMERGGMFRHMVELQRESSNWQVGGNRGGS